jgi:hypothetical protein
MNEKDDSLKDNEFSDFNEGYCWFNRFFFFTHILGVITQNRKKLLKQAENGEEEHLELCDTPNISREQSCDALSRALFDNIKEHIDQGY